METPEPSHPSPVIIGRILKPFGVQGEVRVESLSDVPGRFEGLRDVTLSLPDGETIETTVTSVRQIHEGMLMGFSTFKTPEEANAYRGAWITIPVNHNLPREKDTYYQFELIGLQVEDPEGQHIGKVVEVLEYPQHHVLVIRRKDQEILIPASRRTIEMVDIAHNTLRLASREWWDVAHAL